MATMVALPNNEIIEQHIYCISAIWSHLLSYHHTVSLYSSGICPGLTYQQTTLAQKTRSMEGQLMKHASLKFDLVWCYSSWIIIMLHVGYSSTAGIIFSYHNFACHKHSELFTSMFNFLRFIKMLIRIKMIGIGGLDCMCGLRMYREKPVATV